jgi:hypothetical protein
MEGSKKFQGQENRSYKVVLQNVWYMFAQELFCGTLK